MLFDLRLVDVLDWIGFVVSGIALLAVLAVGWCNIVSRVRFWVGCCLVNWCGWVLFAWAVVGGGFVDLMWVCL